jgi:glycosyltransferase involved in cell wall biosynthesis
MKNVTTNKIKNKPTVTVAIPAYNEGANIGNVLDSLLRQKYEKTRLEKIVVYTDGSTDNTIEVVHEKMHDNKEISLIVGRTQKGKFPRLNQIYKDNTSDVVIVLDADLAIVGDWFVEKFALVIINDPKAMLVSAHEVALKPKDFLGRIIASSYLTWDYIRWSVPNCDHVQNLYARATAYRGSFAKTLYIPDDATEERLYLYLMAKKTNGYRYTRDAEIRYLPVTTMYDYVKLADRAFGRPQPAVNKLVGYDATYHYAIDRKYKLRGTILSFLHDPIFTVLGMMLGVWLSRKTLNRKSVDSAMWEVSLSSKKSIKL